MRFQKEMKTMNEKDEAIEFMQRHLNEFEHEAAAIVEEVSRVTGALTAYSVPMASDALSRVIKTVGGEGSGST